MTSAQTRNATRRQDRRGAALVECALVLPIMIVAVLGMFELGRGVMVTEVLAHAARTGARTGAITTGTTASVTAAVNELLTDSGIKPADCTIQIMVNGVVSEVASAKSGDEILVTVSVPYAKVTWVGNPEYLDGKNLAGRCIMRRE